MWCANYNVPLYLSFIFTVIFCTLFYIIFSVCCYRTGAQFSYKRNQQSRYSLWLQLCDALSKASFGVVQTKYFLNTQTKNPQSVTVFVHCVSGTLSPGTVSQPSFPFQTQMLWLVKLNKWAPMTSSVLTCFTAVC